VGPGPSPKDTPGGFFWGPKANQSTQACKLKTGKRTRLSPSKKKDRAKGSQKKPERKNKAPGKKPKWRKPGWDQEIGAASNAQLANNQQVEKIGLGIGLRKLERERDLERKSCIDKWSCKC